MKQLYIQYPWHSKAWQQVSSWQLSERYPHAIMISGHSGVGKALFAEQLGRGYLCQEGDALSGCGHCKSCHLFDIQGHPDRIYIDPLPKKSNPKEKKNTISVDQVRELSQQMSLTSSYGRKVTIIHTADQLTIGAANSLLKTLEEPPPETMIILLCHTPSLLLATIKSRCQKIAIQQSYDQHTQQWLAEQLSVSLDVAESLLFSFHGAPLKALLQKESGFLEYQHRILQDVSKLSAGKADPVVLAREWLEMGLLNVCDRVYDLAADLLRLRWNKSSRLTYPDSRQTMQMLSSRLDYKALFFILDWCRDTRDSLERNRSYNQQLMLETLITNWQRAFR